MKLEIPQIEAEEFQEKLSSAGKRLAQEGVFELTYRCNLDCLHCYCNDASLKEESKELTFRELCRIMDEAAQEGCLWCVFTGGEPFVRKDFFDLYLYAKKKGFITAILTNAALIDEKAADFLKEWPPRQVEVSLYGITSETHDKVTRTKGSFKKTMEALELLRSRAIALEIKTMVLAMNKKEIKGIKELADKFGAKFRYDPLIHCKLNGDKSPHKARLSAKEAVDIDFELGIMPGYWKKMCGRYAGAAVDCEKLYTCGAGEAMFSVNPYGNLQTCSFPLKSKYNLRSGSFKKGWNEFIPAVIRRKRIKRDFICRNCRIRALCSQCPNWAYLENNNEEEIVGYICDLFQEKARRLGTGML